MREVKEFEYIEVKEGACMYVYVCVIGIMNKLIKICVFVKFIF